MRTRLSLLAATGMLAAACAPAIIPAPTPDSTVAVSRAVVEARVIDVYKSPSCSCCHEWEAYLRDHGWTVRSMPMDDMQAVKQRMGIPERAWSCHTAVVDGYAIEGHVPIEAIDALLAERPAIDGIALPGMPAGSPGMPGELVAPLEVLAVSDGTTSPFELD